MPPIPVGDPSGSATRQKWVFGLGVRGGGTALCLDKVGQMNSEQLQSLAVLALAMVPVALLWRVWIQMLD